jgi:hypothetical protein
MHFSKLILPLAIATSVAAAPATVDPALDTMVDAAAAKNKISGIPSKSIRCGARHPREQVFNVSQIKTAADQALDLVDAGKTLGIMCNVCCLYYLLIYDRRAEVPAPLRIPRSLCAPEVGVQAW